MRWVAIALIRLYQITLSKLLPPSCRFSPTCSCYAVEAFKRFGFFQGGWLAIKRLVKCHPGNPGGDDPVPDFLRKPDENETNLEGS